MKKIIFILCIFFLGYNSVALSTNRKQEKIKQDYQTLWDSIQEKEKNDLPKSSIEIIDLIFEKAIKEKNTQQAIKAAIYKTKFETQINNDKQIAIFADLESLLANTKDKTDKAMLNSLLAELFKNYYITFYTSINQRTNLNNFVPTDLNEWTSNIFIDKTIQHLITSIADSKDLLKVKPNEYSTLIDLGENTQSVYPTMYDFLLNRAISISSETFSNNSIFQYNESLGNLKYNLSDLALPTFDFINLKFTNTGNLSTLFYISKLLKSLDDRKLNEAIVFTELNRNNYLSQSFPLYNSKYSLSFLEELNNRYANSDFSVEIVDAIINNRSNVTNRNSDQSAQNEQIKENYNLLTKTINKFPNYYRINILKNKLDELTQSFISIEANSTYYPTDSKVLKFSYKNIKNINFTITDRENKIVWKKAMSLNPSTSYITYNDSLPIELNKEGSYKVKFNYTNEKENATDSLSINISKLASFTRSLGNQNYSFYVVDSKNSSPIVDAKITIYSREWKTDGYISIPKDSIYTNKEGLATYKALKTDEKSSTNLFYNISKGTDDIKNEISLYSYYNWTFSTDKTRELSRIFTDRNIYRPGQTIFFKAIFSDENILMDRQTPIANKEYTISLYDPNNQEVDKKVLKTNSFGSFSGQFVIPKGLLNGNYSIRLNNTWQSIKVEEYKRPTFDISFNDITNSYTFGDSVTIVGQAKSFSGIELQNLNANFSVKQNKLWWSYWDNSVNNIIIDEGTVKTDNSGNFKITFKIPTNDNTSSLFRWAPNIYNYTVTATITNINGETQSASTNFRVGDVSMTLSSTLPEKIEKSSNLEMNIKAQNLSGKEIETKGTYTIYSLLDNDSINKEVLKGNFITGSQKTLVKDIKTLSSGRYQLLLKAKDDQDREVSSKSTFILYSFNDQKPPYKTNEWLVIKSSTFDKSQDAEIILGTSASNITVLYELLSENTILSKSQFKLSNQNIHIKIPYKKEYNRGISASFTYIINGKAYINAIDIKKKEADQNLTLKWKTFRDKLRPGEKEEWNLLVTLPDGSPANAEVLASMYDASLDKLYTKDIWSSLAGYKQSNTASPVIFYDIFSPRQTYGSIELKGYTIPSLSWSKFNLFNFYFVNNYMYSNLRLGSIKGAAPMMLIRGKGGSAKELMDIDESESLIKGGSNEPNSSQADNKIQIRSNFDETAFFYPQIMTNKQGEAVIRFTVPESNTTWNFRALAYNKDFKYGNIENTVISQKELMVTPNLPRFFRQGDRASISTAISNLSDQAIQGKVSLEFFDPITDQTVDIAIDNQYQNFDLTKNSSSSATWIFSVPENIDVLGCRVVADSKTFSDGEQQAIAVLPNKLLVTESMPIYVNGNENKDFKFDQLINNQSNTLSNYRLTLEYANNPAWYAIQALPTFNNSVNDNALDNFANYYFNTLGLFITNKYPKVKAIIKAWKSQGGTDKTLYSQLEKNEELKAVLLEETPWVLNAKNESDRMQRLSLLFNLNNATQQSATSLQKLTDLQNEDGGWSWFKGMYSNRSMTQYILYGFSELTSLNAVEYNEKEKTMQINALKYIDSKIIEDFNNFKLRTTKDSSYISTNQLEYLFVRSFYRDIPIDKDALEAERFYTSIAENSWTKLNLYERSLLTVVCLKNGKKELSDKLIASLRERATISENQGMFWANNNISAFSSQSAVTVHTFIMNAFKEYGASDNEMNLMKQWLLNQKQTMQWGSSHATLDAVYALLSTGSDWFSNDTNSVKILVNNKTLETSKAEIATGYISKTWNAEQISTKLGNVRVERTGEGPAWGAMYWQYYEGIAKIKSSKNELSIDKKLFIEKNGGLSEITKNSPLKVGDKVTIRLTIRSDRDMNFVMLKDQRASCFEPIEVLSVYQFKNSLSFYQSTLDASTNYYFDTLPKGTYVLEYSVYVNRVGTYANGITTLQSMYAPSFVSHTEGLTVHVE